MSLKKTNLFIVGAARSGTTALWNYLKENPEIFLPGELSQKEPAYFSELKRSRFKRIENYLELYEAAKQTHKWIGDCSTAYLTDPVSANRIYEYNPDSKIIILLRNPVKRAYSLYNWMVQEGYEYAETFEKALELEETRKKKTIPNYYEPEYYYNFLYFNSGLYYQQVKRYIDLFGGNVLLVKFEDIVRDRDAGYAKICNFLEVQPHWFETIGTNQSCAVESSKIQFLLRKITRFFLLNEEELKSIRTNKNQLENRLSEVLKQEIEKLSKVIDIGMLERLKISRRVKNIARLFNANQLDLNLDNKNTRDILMKYGIKRTPPKVLDRKTAFTLSEKYKTDISGLSQYTGIDFSFWIIKD